MDFTKIFKKQNNKWPSGLNAKIGVPPRMKTYNYFCMWSDLLGFGNLFFENNWELNNEQRKQIYSRLQAAHNSVLYYSSPFNERNLILNDGIAKVFKVDQRASIKTKLIEVSIFLRSVIQLHLNINHNELSNEKPGCRTVIAYGEGIQYLANEIYFDDYVMNYTKPTNQSISNIAKHNGNPLIIYNPLELQMNTAFSKAYYLENCGSKVGIIGNNLFIDQSVIDAISNMAKKEKFPIHFSETTENIQFIIPYTIDDFQNVILGFSLDKNIIEIEVRGWKTKVYKVLNFFPHDEKMNEFSFNLHDIMANFK